MTCVRLEAAPPAEEKHLASTPAVAFLQTSTTQYPVPYPLASKHNPARLLPPVFRVSTARCLDHALMGGSVGKHPPSPN